MNTIVLIFLGILCLICLLLSLFSCLRTYRAISRQKKERRIRRYVHQNRGKIGESQQWRCWQCHSVMLSKYDIVRVEEDMVAALCSLCTSGQKYEHIYKETTEVEVPIDSYA